MTSAELTLFPTDNDLEIPSLDPSMQAEAVEMPFVLYGEQSRATKMNGFGTLCFYTDDYRFRAVWDHPERIEAHNPASIVEPNFSLCQDMPVAMGLREVYRKRALARMMQGRGIRVFVDLNVASKFYRVNLLGVPPGWRAFCTRGYSDRPAYLEFEWMMAREVAGGDPLFVIYGGGDKCRQFAKERGCVYVSPMIDIKNRSRRAIKAIEQSVAFLGPGADAARLVEEATRGIAAAQIEAFNKKTIDEA